MSRRKRSKASFVKLDRNLMRSPAYKALKPTSIAVYLQILYGHNGSNGSPSDPIYCPYSRIGLAPATIKKAIDELEEKGFIKCVERGGLYQKANGYALLQQWRLWKPSPSSNMREKVS